jgi:hypothetical protein
LDDALKAILVGISPPTPTPEAQSEATPAIAGLLAVSKPTADSESGTPAAAPETAATDVNNGGKPGPLNQAAVTVVPHHEFFACRAIDVSIGLALKTIKFLVSKLILAPLKILRNVVGAGLSVLVVPLVFAVQLLPLVALVLAKKSPLLLLLLLLLLLIPAKKKKHFGEIDADHEWGPHHEDEYHHWETLAMGSHDEDPRHTRSTKEADGGLISNIMYNFVTHDLLGHVLEESFG